MRITISTKLPSFYQTHFIAISKQQSDPKKQEPIQILLNLININRISKNLIDLNINLYCLKYAPNGRNSIGGRLADVTQNCQSFQHISFLGFLKFLLNLMPLVHQCLN